MGTVTQSRPDKKNLENAQATIERIGPKKTHDILAMLDNKQPRQRIIRELGVDHYTIEKVWHALRPGEPFPVKGEGRQSLLNDPDYQPMRKAVEELIPTDLTNIEIMERTGVSEHMLRQIVKATTGNTRRFDAPANKRGPQPRVLRDIPGTYIATIQHQLDQGASEYALAREWKLTVYQVKKIASLPREGQTGTNGEQTGVPA